MGQLFILAAPIRTHYVNIALACVFGFWWWGGWIFGLMVIAWVWLKKNKLYRTVKHFVEK